MSTALSARSSFKRLSYSSVSASERKRTEALRRRYCATKTSSHLERNQVVGDTDIRIADVTLGTMTFGKQNTEKDAHAQLNFAVKEFGVNSIDTAEMYAVPADTKTQGKTDEYIGSWLRKDVKREEIILMTKVAGRSQMQLRGRNPGEENRLTAKQMELSVECSLERLQTDYVDVLQLHWPDRYVSLFGGVPYERKS